MPEARNVLFITLDQFRGDGLSVAGHPMVRTPHLDRLAAEGVLFRRHYSQAAPCSPGRASLYTGLYQLNHRVCLNGTPLDVRFTNVALEARSLGYDPVLFGYTDQSIDPRTVAQDDPRLRTYQGVLPGLRAVVDLTEDLKPWLAWLATKGYDIPENGRDIYRPADGGPERDSWPEPGGSNAPTIYAAEHSEAAFLVGEVTEWIDRQDDGPWFAHVAFIRPHPPYIAPEPYNTMYDPDDEAMPMPVRAATPDAEGAQHLFASFVVNAPGLAAPRDERATRQLRATYFGMQSEVDAQVGRLVAHLEAAGILDDTLIVLGSDHGEMLGDHWLTQKLGYWDSAYHVPLIVRDPRPGADATRGTQVQHFTENVDVMPTIVEWMGGEVPAQCDGRSLLPFLRDGAPDDWRTETHFEFDFRDPVDHGPETLLGVTSEQCCMTVLRDARGKYVHFAALDPIFFDLDDDPAQLVNRADDPAYANDVLAYAQRMLSWRMRHTDRTLTGTFLSPSGVTDRRDPRV